MNVSELRDELVRLGMNEEDANLIKGKENLEEQIGLLKGSSSIIDDAIDSLSDVKTDDIVITEVKEDEYFEDCLKNGFIDPASMNTQDEIFSLFREDELVDGKYPKVDSLRRVSNLVIGPIVDETTRTEQIAWNLGKEEVASGIKCDFSVSFSCRNDNFGDINSIIRFSDSSDCIPDLNCFSDTFGRHPTAMACTRAEARALRKALRLNVVSAEEIQDATSNSTYSSLTNDSGEEYIKEHQIMFLKKACSNKEININDFLERLEIEKGGIEELTKSEFEKIIENLSKL